jgi:hypothetical protein
MARAYAKLPFDKLGIAEVSPRRDATGRIAFGCTPLAADNSERDPPSFAATCAA